MPIYAYKCSSCGFAKDVLQKISDPPLVVCSACGEPTFGKQVTAAGFQLKGSGWYATDFKGAKPAGEKKNGDGGGAGDQAEAGKAEGSDGGGEAKADAKPASGKTGAGSPGEAPAAKSSRPAAPPSGDGG